ncbi:MAG: hypothetical protein SWH68_07790 [Thermodesulfobacteriota bacterium]|nr:hypothetical protein [Thermodesulfobacteriota bacterium]
MHALYEPALELAAKLKDARLQAASLSQELLETEYQLKVTKAAVERELIKKVKNEKALGHTLEDRTRIFTRALDADTNYQALRKKQAELSLKVEEAKIEVSYLRDKLSITLAAMKAPDAVEPERPLYPDKSAGSS